MHYRPPDNRQSERKRRSTREQSKSWCNNWRELKDIQRKGLVLAFLMRFKQICNHPSQWSGDGEWSPEDSGKWAIADVIAAKQEKVRSSPSFAK